MSTFFKKKGSITNRMDIQILLNSIKPIILRYFGALHLLYLLPYFLQISMVLCTLKNIRLLYPHQTSWSRRIGRSPFYTSVNTNKFIFERLRISKKEKTIL